MRNNSRFRTAILYTLLMVLMTQATYFSNVEFIDEIDVIENQEIRFSASTGTATQLAVGDAHSCAISATGTVKCWGHGSEGQLGIGNTLDLGDDPDEMGMNLPFLDLGTGIIPTSLALGDEHTCALFDIGAIKCWGDVATLGLGFSESEDGFGDGYLETGDMLPFLSLPSGATATMIEAGGTHTCAVLDNDDLICWGANQYGQLGMGNTTPLGNHVSEVGDGFSIVELPPGRNVSQLALGNTHTCAIWDDGSVSCWGSNDNGELGLENTNYIGDGGSEMGSNLGFVSFPNGNTAENITAGDGFTCAILNNSDTVCWGDSQFGQLGIENTNNIGDQGGEMGNSLGIIDFGTSRNAVEIDAGSTSVCAILDNAQVKCWGQNDVGQLGLGDTLDRGDGFNEMGNSLQPVNIGGSADRIEVGDKFACIILTTDGIKCWGTASNGRLGYEDLAFKGDDSLDMPTDDVELKLDNNFEGDDCNELFTATNPSMEIHQIDASTAEVGKFNSMTLRSDGCPALAYTSGDDNRLRFATYVNGLWTIEILGDSTGEITDLDIVVDSNDVPHIVHSEAGSGDEIHYSTKENGRWVTLELSGVATNLELVLHTDDTLEILMVLGDDSLRSAKCSSSCSSGLSWTSSQHDELLVTDNFDAVIDSENTIHIVGIFDDGDGDLNNDSLTYYHLLSDGTSTNFSLNSSAFGNDENSSIAISISPDDSVHIVHETYDLGLIYSSCSGSCDSINNWQNETLPYDTGIFDLAIDADHEPYLVLNNLGQLKITHRSEGVWTTPDLVYTLDPISTSISIDKSGRVWIADYTVDYGDLWIVSNIGYSGTGLYVDSDGDGWNGLDEIRCLTDRFDETSIPADFDKDGICDRFDTKDDSLAISESSVITNGDDFSCATLEDRKVACWGTNDQGQLGSVLGIDNVYDSALEVDLPEDFTVISMDSGTSHTCAVDSGGSLMCWGANDQGQLGLGNTSVEELPTLVSFDEDVTILSVSAGDEHTCATTSTGEVYCWGSGSDKQLGEYYEFDSNIVLTETFADTDIDGLVDLSLGWDQEITNPWVQDSTTDIDGSTYSWKSPDIMSPSSTSSFSTTVDTFGGNISFSYKTSTDSSDKLQFYIDGLLMGEWSGPSNTWTQNTSSFGTGVHTFMWVYDKDANNIGGLDTVWIDDIEIQTSKALISGQDTSTPKKIIIESDVGFVDSITAGKRHNCVTNSEDNAYCWGYNGGPSTMTLGNSSTVSTDSSSLVRVDHEGVGGIGLVKSDYLFKALSAGEDVTCSLGGALDEVRCWGLGVDGTVMLGSASPSINGTEVGDLKDNPSDLITSISVGQRHVCAVVDESIKCWGEEAYGELGDGGSSVTSTNVPVTVTGMPAGYTPVEVSVNGHHSCALFNSDTDSSDYRIMCWGKNKGQLGLGISVPPDGPESLVDWVQFGFPASGDLITSFKTPDISKTYYRVEEIAAGTNFYCARSIQGLVKCWGQNDQGQLGIGNTTQYGDNANETGGHLPFVDLGTNNTAKQIVAGSIHVCALLNTGSVVCWGDNVVNQVSSISTSYNIGDLSSEMGDSLVPINFGVTNSNIIKLSAGGFHTCALFEDGDVKCWGANGAGQLGKGTTYQSAIADISVDFGNDLKALDISMGYDHSCAVLENALMKCWGDNRNAELGIGLTTTSIGNSNLGSNSDFRFTDLGKDKGIVEIKTGEAYSCALVTNGEVYCWGTPYTERLGHGFYQSHGNSIGDSETEMGDNLVAVDFGTNIKTQELYLSAGEVNLGYSNLGTPHSCAINSDGSVRCWGRNSHGQLGIESSTDVGDDVLELGDNFVITDVGGTVESLALGYLSTCAIMIDGQVKCWGYNGYGQLAHEDNIGVGSSVDSMGNNLPVSDIWLKAKDTDDDGTIDLWDTDDDNDNSLDVDDKFILDACAYLDTDNDGKPDSIVVDCITNLVEDLDDDDDTWTDLNETACETDPIDASSIPLDTDGDYLCNKFDLDDDDDGWSDILENICEPRHEFLTMNSAYRMSSGSSSANMFFDGDGLLHVIGNDRWNDPSIWRHQDDTSTQPVVKKLNDSPSSNNKYNSEFAEYDGTIYIAQSGSLQKLELSQSSINSASLEQIGTWGNYNNQPTDMAISPDGKIYLTASTEFQVYDITNDTWDTSDYPTDSTVGFSQIAFDDDGKLFFVGTGVAGGLRSWSKVAGSNWSTSTLIDGSVNSNSVVSTLNSELLIDSNGDAHLIYMNGGKLDYLEEKITGWESQFNTTKPSQTEQGVDLILDENDKAHIAWHDASNGTAYYTTYDESTSTWVSTLVRQHTTNWHSTNLKSIKIVVDDYDDPYIFTTLGSGNSYTHSQVQYLGKYSQSIDVNDFPGDADGDGICDALDQATLEYEVTDLVFEVNTASEGYLATFTGLKPNSISISPELPEGLNFDTTTGDITGIPLETDLAGTNYEISTTSSNDPFSLNITIKIWDQSPLLSGYEILPVTPMNSYTQDANGQKGNQVRFGSDGSMFFSSSYYYNTGTGEYFEGIPVLPSHDTDDLFVAKRGIDKKWDWVRTINLCSGHVKDLEIDVSNNIYVLVEYQGLTSSSCDVSFLESPSFNFESTNGRDIFVAKYDENGNLLWVTNSDSPQSPNNQRTFMVTPDSGISVENNGEVTVSFSAKTAASQTITFGGVAVDYGLSCIGYYTPYVSRLDSLGSVSWISAPTHVQSAVHASYDCNDVSIYPYTDVISHSDGSATMIGKFRKVALGFGSTVLDPPAATSYSTFIAHLDSSGTWQWAKNITYTGGMNQVLPSIEEYSDGSISIVYSSFDNDAGDLNFAGNITTFSNSEKGWLCAARMSTTGDLIWNSCNKYGGKNSAGELRTVIDSDDEVHILVDPESSNVNSYFHLLGVNSDGFQTYFSGTKGGSNGNWIYDFGLDEFDLPYFIAEMNNNQWGGTTAATEYSNGQLFSSSSYPRMYRTFGEIDHTIAYMAPANNTYSDILAMGSTYNYDASYEEFVTWSIYPELPQGLSFDTNYGRIHGTPTNFTNTNITYMLNATISDPVERTISVNITFGVAPEIPIVEFDVANHTNVGILEYNLVKGESMEILTPDIQTPQYLSYFKVEPNQLPSGITLDTSTGVISGSPTQNLTSQLFNIKSCNSWDVCDSGQIIMFTIVEPAPNITYPELFYEVKRDAPIVPISLLNTGGPIEYFTISPSLPLGVTLDSNGRISGIPVENTHKNYTITAYNSGGSSTTHLEIAVNGTGLYIFYPYDEFNLAINYPIQNEFVPSSQGVAVASWDISPGLPEGLYFSESEGSIWGVPLELRPEMDYTITAVGIDPTLIDSFTISLAVLTDYDADGKPDGDESNSEYWMDIDDDNDNWSDAEEIACSSVPGQYNPLDSNDYPSDLDLDGICDLLDDFNDAPIIMAYPNINLELSLNMPMPAQTPILEGGGILTWEISPELPDGLVFNEYSGVSINLARSNDFEGMVSGTPTELMPPTIFTITAQNAMTTASFEITISVLIDTNLDTVPDIYDDDDDGDGWTDEMETLCNSNSLNSSIKPTDHDGDTICDEIDDDDDNDDYIDSEEVLCSSNPLNESSIPIYSSEDEPDVCDALLQDTDQDGWSDGMENACGTSSNSSADRPADQDVDGLCDTLDDDDDNDGWLDDLDAFPYDSNEWLDTDNDGLGNNEDTDDDNDEWIDSWEDVCSTDSLDNYSTPLDLDGDGFCDVLDQDSDDDGVVDANDAFPDDPSASMDTDGDGLPDTLIGISTSNPPLVEDLDDDNDGWNDKNEIACGTDPLSSIAFPPEGVSCELEPPPPVYSTWYWCCALIFLLLVLLIPLVFLAGERGNNVLMYLGVNVGPQPANTIFEPVVAVGKGTRREPFVLAPITGIKMGDSVESKETITITKLQLGTEIRVEDLDSVENENRFSMDLIEVQEDDSEEEGFGSIVFRLQFNDNKAAFGTQTPYGEFIGNIRIGNASVYVTWSVTVVGSPEAIEAAEKEIEDSELNLEEEAEAEEKAAAEAEEKAAAEEARIKKVEDEAREKIAREAKEKVEVEERIKKAEDEAREKAKEEVKKEAEEKAAVEERIKKAEQDAKEKVESDAQSRLAEMEEKMAKKMAEMEEKMEGLSKKEAELVRVAAKAEFIDFDILGVSESTEISEEIENGAKTVTLKDASKFPEQGLGYINDPSGENISIKWKAKDGNILTGVSGVKRLVSAGSIIFNKDDLKRTKGIGPFIEEKLNALGIHTFLQVSKMDEELEDQVNVAIEFFPGRVKRDKWVNQAKKFVEEDKT